jgi:aldose 1-epimerase
MGNSGRHATHVRTRCWAYIGGIGILLICWLAVIAGKAVGRASLARRAAQSLAEQTEGSRNLVLRNRRGIEVHLLRTGASIQKLLLPDRNGKFADVVLGFDEEVAYSDGRSPYFGAIVGRVANRIANASFELDSATYRLATNERGMPGSLHGGRRGFDKVRWNAARVAPCASERRQGAKCRRGDEISMRYQSAAGEEGYPGTLDVEVTYTLTDADELIQTIRATTDAPTIINLAQVLRAHSVLLAMSMHIACTWRRPGF